MKKTNKTYVIFSCCLILGIALFFLNAKNLEYNTLFNEHSVSDNTNEMRMNYAIAGYSYDSNLNELYKGIYQKKANSGNTAIWGIAIASASLIVMFACYLSQMKAQSNAQMKQQAELLDKLSKSENQGTNNASARSADMSSDIAVIMEYKELLDRGIISQEEFEAKKKQLLNL